MSDLTHIQAVIYKLSQQLSYKLLYNNENISGSDTVISWVRRRDLHILTIATITYTADRRWTSIIIKPLMLSSALFTVKQ